MQGNALVNGLVLPAQDGRAHAMHFRKQIVKPRMHMSGISCFTMGFLKSTDVLVSTTWAKIQHLPTFGTTAYKMFVLDFGWYMYPFPVACIYQMEDGGFYSIISGLNVEQAECLIKDHESFGSEATCRMHSDAEVADAFKQLRK
eukprot:TRINITY_DN60364_c0_g1_i1.p1 TRINITY_DN60364_c0_g1~~TRINITY_DN60364_c0_g1_i1.p1  ORF type:complete len:156 (+),score=13.56 TRINITY_DN60364_c0_g1_i1:39-470(+)